MVESNEPTPIYTCDNREPGASPDAAGQFFPVFAGEVSPSNPQAVYAGTCFEEI